MPSSESETVTIVLIAAGCIVGVLLISFAAYMITQKCKNRDNANGDAAGERAFLLGINAEGGGAVVNPREKWPFGDLDRAGVARVLKWLKEVVMPALNAQGGSQEFTDAGSSMGEYHAGGGLLGEDDGLATPTQRYSPRVSNISQNGGSTRAEVSDLEDRLVDDGKD